MKLYLLSQDENNDWDTYDSMVVAAKSPADARKIHPDDRHEVAASYLGWGRTYSTWASKPEKVDVEYLGPAKQGTKRGVILASFNAG